MIKKEVYVAFKKMHSDAKLLGLNLWITSAYRDYNYQNWLYNNSIKKNGIVITNKETVKSGFSEHQTGLAIDIL